jgi:hypothetical protein
MPKIYENIAVTLDSAEKNLKALLSEYEKSLSARTVSAEATDFTHQICTQLRSVLDRTAFRCWNLKVAPSLSENERNGAKSRIYFPGATSQASFDSTLGTWRLKQADHPDLHSYLLAQQPFASDKNKWLAVLFDLAVQGKHIDLVPQKRVESKTTTVTGPAGGAVSWGPGGIAFSGGSFGSGGAGISGGGSIRGGGSISFGEGGSITFGPEGTRFAGKMAVMGAPIDPLTQPIIPTPGHSQRVEIWVSFLIDGHGVDAGGFCKEACQETRRIVQEMTERFGLS